MVELGSETRDARPIVRGRSLFAGGSKLLDLSGQLCHLLAERVRLLMRSCHLVPLLTQALLLLTYLDS